MPCSIFLVFVSNLKKKTPTLCLYQFFFKTKNQVAVIYCGVRGYLDKMDPTKITKFEKEFLQHIKANEQGVLSQISTEGQITDATNAKLKDIVTKFLSTFS